LSSPTLFPYTTLFRSAEDAQLRNVICAVTDERLSVAVSPFNDDISRFSLAKKDVVTVRPSNTERTGIGVQGVVTPLQNHGQATADRKSTRLNSSHGSI